MFGEDFDNLQPRVDSRRVVGVLIGNHRAVAVRNQNFTSVLHAAADEVREKLEAQVTEFLVDAPGQHGDFRLGERVAESQPLYRAVVLGGKLFLPPFQFGDALFLLAFHFKVGTLLLFRLKRGVGVADFLIEGGDRAAGRRRALRNPGAKLGNLPVQLGVFLCGFIGRHGRKLGLKFPDAVLGVRSGGVLLGGGIPQVGDSLIALRNHGFVGLALSALFRFREPVGTAQIEIGLHLPYPFGGKALVAGGTDLAVRVPAFRKDALVLGADFLPPPRQPVAFLLFPPKVGFRVLFGAAMGGGFRLRGLNGKVQSGILRSLRLDVFRPALRNLNLKV